MAKYHFLDNIKHICANCDKRHGECTMDHGTIVTMLDQHTPCPEFIPGLCFYCALQQLGDDGQCMDVFYPCGCANFKDGRGYEQYIQMLKADQEIVDAAHDIHFRHNDEHRKALERRRRTKRYKKKLQNQSRFTTKTKKSASKETNKQPNQLSKSLKKQAHKRVRQMDVNSGVNFSHGLHKKLFSIKQK